MIVSPAAFISLSVIFLITAIVLYIITKEGFYSSDYYPKNIYFTGEDPNVISHGTVRKTKLEDGEILYEYFYNLPNAFSEFQIVRPGVLFNEKLPIGTYSVFAGQTKESLQKIGTLSRRGDGYHIFSIKTKEDYKVTAIQLEDKVLHYLDL